MLVTVITFIGLVFLDTLMIQRDVSAVASSFRHETYLEKGADPKLVALANALLPLQSGQAPTTPFQCSLSVKVDDVSSTFEVDYTKSASDWVVEVKPVTGSLAACPSTF